MTEKRRGRVKKEMGKLSLCLSLGSVLGDTFTTLPLHLHPACIGPKHQPEVRIGEFRIFSVLSWACVLPQECGSLNSPVWVGPFSVLLPQRISSSAFPPGLSVCLLFASAVIFLPQVAVGDSFAFQCFPGMLLEKPLAAWESSQLGKWCHVPHVSPLGSPQTGQRRQPKFFENKVYPVSGAGTMLRMWLPGCEHCRAR